MLNTIAWANYVLISLGNKNEKLKSAASKISKNKDSENNPDRKHNEHNYTAAIIAISLLSFGIIGLTSVMMISFILYHKRNKGRDSTHNIESGVSGRHTPRVLLRKARSGPNNIRLKSPR